MASLQMESTLEGIGHILSDNKLAVPLYQRSYAWEERHVTDLLQDLTAAIRDSEPEYFLGSIVISRNGSGRPEVVDGQQRLATTAILISAIRDYFDEIGEKEIAGDLQRDYLVERDRRTQELTPKLQLNERDHDFFFGTSRSCVGRLGRSLAESRGDSPVSPRFPDYLDAGEEGSRVDFVARCAASPLTPLAHV